MTYIEEINSHIKERFGYDFRDRPAYRVVWSDSQTEKRRGPHEKWYGSIFLGYEFGVKEVKKYDFIQERWVLEKLFPNNFDSSGIWSDITYEPLYVFQTPQGEYLEPTLRAAHLLCWWAQNPKQRKRDFKAEAQEKIEKEIEYFTDYLNDKHSFLHTQMKHGEAIINPGVPNVPST